MKLKALLCVALLASPAPAMAAIDLSALVSSLQKLSETLHRLSAAIESMRNNQPGVTSGQSEAQPEEQVKTTAPDQEPPEDSPENTPEDATPTNEVARPAAQQPAFQCKEGTKAQENAFRASSVINAGLSEQEAAGLDFSCRDQGALDVANDTQPEVTTDEQQVSQQEPAVTPDNTEQATATGSAAPIGQYNLTWQSSGLGDWNTREPWTPPEGGKGYGEAWNDPGNVSEQNGVISLAATKCNKGGFQICGSEVTTRGKKDDFVHGYVEVTAKIPDGRGLFPAALWLIGDGQWPASGEIDVHEGVNNGRDDGKTFFTAHWAGCGGKCQVSDPSAPLVENKSDWHTYGLERTADAIRQYVDGQLTGEITREEAAAKGGEYSVIFDAPMHLRADIGSGGVWAQHESGIQDPGVLQIKDVKIYE